MPFLRADYCRATPRLLENYMMLQLREPRAHRDQRPRNNRWFHGVRSRIFTDMSREIYRLRGGKSRDARARRTSLNGSIRSFVGAAAPRDRFEGRVSATTGGINSVSFRRGNARASLRYNVAAAFRLHFALSFILSPFSPPLFLPRF